MVIIKLTNGYFIEKEKLDYVLKKEYIATSKQYPEGHLTVKDVGYYGKKLDHAINDYLSLVQSESMDGVIFHTMSDYVRTIQNINDLTVKQIIHTLGA